MSFRFPLLGSFVVATACFGCSSESASDDTPDAGVGAGGTCPGVGAPAGLRIAEGGRIVVPRTGGLENPGLTFEGVGARVVSNETTITIHVPYIDQADAELSLDVRCAEGTTRIPITLKALAWQKLAEGGSPTREYGSFWLDPEGGLVLFGGFQYEPKQFTPANDAWRFDFASNAWAQLTGTSLPTLPGGRVASIPGSRAVYFYGGAETAANGSLTTPPSLYRFDYDATTIAATAAPKMETAPGSYTGGLVYDSKRARWLSVCGLDPAVGVHCDVHAYTPETGFELLEVAKGSKPRGRYGFHYAYDEETDRIVVFAGSDGSGPKDIAADTWALELGQTPPAWVSLSKSSEVAAPRRNGAFALDPVGHRMFVWGGTPDGRNSVAGLQALSLDRDSETWSHVATLEEPIARTSGFAVYDPARSRMLFGFGNGAAVYADLWALDLSNDPITR